LILVVAIVSMIAISAKTNRLTMPKF